MTTPEELREFETHLPPGTTVQVEPMQMQHDLIDIPEASFRMVCGHDIGTYGMSMRVFIATRGILSGKPFTRDDVYEYLSQRIRDHVKTCPDKNKVI
jgi:hypothetical protein